MRIDKRWCWYAWLLPIAACLTLGQTCDQPTTNVPVTSACGLHAAYCVEVIGKSPIAIASGDFNGDGRPDAAVANFGTDNYEVLINDGDGVLTPGGRYKAGDSPGSIIAADLDGDGKPDLAASDGSGIAILISRGDGTFQSPAHLVLDQTINAFPLTVTAADFNGDGAIDLVASAMGWRFDLQAMTVSNADNVALLLNDGAGGFSLTSTMVLDNPYPRLGDVTAGDVDGDGRPDLVIDQSSGTLSVLHNQDGGSFTNAASVSVGENHVLNDVKLADLDGDGRLDLLVADNGDWLEPGGGGVAVFRNESGSFTAASVLVAGDASTSMAIADYDGDGLPDLAVANNTSNDVAVLFNLGGGTFGSPVRFETGAGPTGIVAADFNGDGAIDLAVAHMASGAVGVYLNDGAGGFAP